ncbi:hypothetical protein ES703_24216 [subsurface metagenome]
MIAVKMNGMTLDGEFTFLSISYRRLSDIVDIITGISTDKHLIRIAELDIFSNELVKLEIIYLYKLLVAFLPQSCSEYASSFILHLGSFSG